MSRIERAVGGSEPALIPYVCAGDPDLASTAEYVRALDRGGADVIELGLPFSEPIAEGPTIQASVARALASGTTTSGYFDLVAGLDVDPPLICMTYYNLLYSYGSGGATERERVEPFVADAAAAGIEGLIVPDLPLDEGGPLREVCADHGIDLVNIVAPTTEGERLDRLMETTSGFAYVQARLGTTGARADVSEHTHASLKRLADYDVPKAVGFGVSEAEHAREIVAAGADGVIVGSALVEIVAEGEAVPERLESLVRDLKEGALAGAEEVPRSERT
ncbi:tryptophan synthase subunit alpha [Halovivax sp.]|uniref:tryptophan synthase subunit alpha n=1 Tax=Halovivax sp. TaxID=1935978 RepID=UPI0025B928C4|nr:tryptophan synthase subunit alpha [Halovivax sp.]